jgi:RNA polymerase sigma factor (sigma-70 family)
MHEGDGVMRFADLTMQGRLQPEDLAALAIEAKTDPQVFGRLYEHYVPSIYRYLYSRVGTVHVAEDLTSQTFMAAFKSLPRYHERGQFSAWLFRIARSKLTDHYRGNRHEESLEAADGLVLGPDTLASVMQNETLTSASHWPVRKDDGRRLVEMADFGNADAVKKSVLRLWRASRARWNEPWMTSLFPNSRRFARSTRRVRA